MNDPRPGVRMLLSALPILLALALFVGAIWLMAWYFGDDWHLF